MKKIILILPLFVFSDTFAQIRTTSQLIKTREFKNFHKQSKNTIKQDVNFIKCIKDIEQLKSFDEVIQLYTDTELIKKFGKRDFKERRNEIHNERVNPPIECKKYQTP